MKSDLLRDGCKGTAMRDKIIWQKLLDLKLSTIRMQIVKHFMDDTLISDT